MFSAYDRYYQRLDIGIKWKQHNLLLSNSFITVHYFVMCKSFAGWINYDKKRTFFNFLHNLMFCLYTDRFQLNKRFFSKGNTLHLNYGQKRNLKLMGKDYIQCITLFNCFAFNTCVTKPSPCLPLPPIDLAYNHSMFQPLKFIPTIRLNFCLHSTYKHTVLVLS